MEALSAVTIAALAGGIAVVIAAVAAGIVSIITAWRSLADNVSKIQGHVNSEKTAAEGREKLLRRENELLREALHEHKTTASLLAQAAVQTGGTVVTAPALVVPPTTAAAKTLKQIEQHTKATAENTERTEAKVDDLKTP